jgi:hypothetical protein
VADAGLSLSLAGPARLYVGHAATHLREVAGRAMTTVRVVSDLPAVKLFVRDLAPAGGEAAHFVSDDNGALTLVVNEVPAEVAGLSSHGHVSVQHAFRFSGDGQSAIGDINGSPNPSLFDRWVAAAAPFASLDVASGRLSASRGIRRSS